MIVMPKMLMFGAIIPIGNSGGVLMVLGQCMPMAYCLDLARALVCASTPEYSGVVMFNSVVNFAAVAVLPIRCEMVGTFFFAKSEKNR